MSPGRVVSVTMILANGIGFAVFLAARPAVPSNYQTIPRFREGNSVRYEPNSATPALVGARQLDLHNGESTPVRLVMISNVPAVILTFLVAQATLPLTDTLSDSDHSWVVAAAYLIAVALQWLLIGHIVDLVLRRARKTAVA